MPLDNPKLRRQRIERDKASCAPCPCSVERTPKTVIEKKLLAALDDDDKVAILASKQDLEDMIAALYGYKIGEREGNILSWESHMKRCKDLADGMSQLLREAFPPNTDSTTPSRIL